MRNHRAMSEQLHARFGTARRQLLPVARVFVARRPHLVIAAGRDGADVHLSFALSLAVSSQRIETNVHHQPASYATHSDAVSTVPTEHPSSASAALAGAPRTELARLASAPLATPAALASARQEARVVEVRRVVTHAAAPTTASDASREAAASSAWPPARDPRQPTTTSRPSSPTPAELTMITNHVLTAIDHRLIAHNERLGRG